MPNSPQPDPLDTSDGYRASRQPRPDWDATAATEGGARSDGRGSTVFSDRGDPPLMADPPLRRGRILHLWRRVYRRLRALATLRPS